MGSASDGGISKLCYCVARVSNNASNTHTDATNRHYERRYQCTYRVRQNEKVQILERCVEHCPQGYESNTVVRIDVCMDVVRCSQITLKNC